MGLACGAIDRSWLEAPAVARRDRCGVKRAVIGAGVKRAVIGAGVKRAVIGAG